MRLLLIVLLISNFLYAQEKENIEIVYSERVFWIIEDSAKYSKEHIDAKKRAMEEKNFYKLRANKEESLYDFIPKINNNQSNNSFNITYSTSEKYIYKNLQEKLYFIEETYPKSFFIKDSLSDLNWDLKDDLKKYKDYAIKSANCYYKDYYVTAWYTEDIKISSGPKLLGGLPGIILIAEMEHKNGEKVQLLAEKINYTKFQKVLKPKTFKEDKIISRKEYEVILNDFIKKEDEMFNLNIDNK